MQQQPDLDAIIKRYGGTVAPPPTPAAQGVDLDAIIRKYGGTTTPSKARKSAAFKGLVEHYATQAGLDPELVYRVIDAESNGNPKAVSPKKAKGLMQLMDATAAEYAVSDPFDPEQNIRAGTSYLKKLLDQYGGDEAKALAAYNAGPTAVNKHNGVPPYPETQAYVAKITAGRGGQQAPPAPTPAGSDLDIVSYTPDEAPAEAAPSGPIQPRAQGVTDQTPRIGPQTTLGKIKEGVGDFVQNFPPLRMIQGAANAVKTAGDEVVSGLPQMARGIAQLTPAGSAIPGMNTVIRPSQTPEEYAKGLNDLAEGSMKVGAPLIIPALASNPAFTAAMIAAATVASDQAVAFAKRAGWGEEYQRLAGNAAALTTLGLGGKRLTGAALRGVESMARDVGVKIGQRIKQAPPEAARGLEPPTMEAEVFAGGRGPQRPPEAPTGEPAGQAEIAGYPAPVPPEARPIPVTAEEGNWPPRQEPVAPPPVVAEPPVAPAAPEPVAPAPVAETPVQPPAAPEIPGAQALRIKKRLAQTKAEREAVSLDALLTALPPSEEPGVGGPLEDLLGNVGVELSEDGRTLLWDAGTYRNDYNRSYNSQKLKPITVAKLQQLLEADRQAGNTDPNLATALAALESAKAAPKAPPPGASVNAPPAPVAPSAPPPPAPVTPEPPTPDAPAAPPALPNGWFVSDGERPYQGESGTWKINVVQGRGGREGVYDYETGQVEANRSIFSGFSSPAPVSTAERLRLAGHEVVPLIPEGQIRSSVPDPTLDERLAMRRKLADEMAREGKLSPDLQRGPTRNIATLPAPASPSPAQAENALRPPSEIAPEPVAPVEPAKPVATKTGDYVQVDARQIKVAPKVYQFKESDAEGVTGALRNVAEWDELQGRATPVVLHQTTDGTLYVADGHQRVNLAQRLLAQGKPVPPLNAVVYREADGYTAADMRRVAALVNVRQDSATAVDIAKLLREGPLSEQEQATIPKNNVRGERFAQAQELTKLSDPAFQAVVNGELPAAQAQFVGRHVTDPAQQVAAIRALAKADLPNAYQAERFVKELVRDTFATETQLDMFGEHHVAFSLAKEKAQVLDAVKRALSSQKSAFGNALRNQAKLEGAGNVLNADVNAQLATEAGRFQALLDVFANKSGYTQAALRDAARRVHDRELSPADAVDAVIAALERDFRGDPPPSGGPSAPAESGGGRPSDGRGVGSESGGDRGPDEVLPVSRAELEAAGQSSMFGEEPPALPVASSTLSIGDRVRVMEATLHGKKPHVGQITRVLQNGTLEIKMQQGGYAIAKPEEVEAVDAGQPALPGAESVREQDIPTPTFEAPYSLSAEADTTPKTHDADLFAAPEAVVDVLDTGESQPRLPGAESVRDTEREMPSLGTVQQRLDSGEPLWKFSRRQLDEIGGVEASPQYDAWRKNYTKLWGLYQREIPSDVWDLKAGQDARAAIEQIKTLPMEVDSAIGGGLALPTVATAESRLQVARDAFSQWEAKASFKYPSAARDIANWGIAIQRIGKMLQEGIAADDMHANTHLVAVRDAIRNGKSVRPDVLDAYPGLAPKPASPSKAESARDAFTDRKKGRRK